MLKIDIIVAVYNGEPVIRRCIESLFKTEYPNKEIIVVNDGSTDRTGEILNDYSDRIIILEKENGGVSDARNFAIRWSSADIIAITDGDCEVAPDWISKAIRYFEDGKIGAVTGWLHYKITNTLSAVREMEYAVRFKSRKKEARSVSCPVALFRREALASVSGFDTAFKVGGEDTDIGYKLIEKGWKVIYEPEMKVYHEAEDNLRLYLKRNYRNVKNYMMVFFQRKKDISIHDDFFQILLRLQPLLTLLFVLTLALFYINNFFLLPSIILVGILLYANLEVIYKVVRIKGLFSIPITLGILGLRNLVWFAAIITGTWRALR